MSTSPLFWLRPLSICLTSQLYLWEYIWSSQQILISLFGFLQIKAHSSKFNLVFRSHSVLESLRKFGLALNLWKWQCSEGVVWFGFNELFLSLFPDNSWCPWLSSWDLTDLTLAFRMTAKTITTTNRKRGEKWQYTPHFYIWVIILHSRIIQGNIDYSATSERTPAGQRLLSLW